MDILAELNPAQREAVEATGGPLLILAGPGSGKTRVITHRVAYLIKVCGVSPHRIMVVTFTNKAMREMEGRLFGKSEEDPATPLLGWGERGQVTAGTFHAICARILRRDGKAIGVDRGFVIYDDEDQISLIKRSLVQLGLDPKQYAPRAIASAISAAKSHLLAPPEYVQQGRSYFDEVVGRVYERYQQLLGESSALDFDDLLMKAVQLFRAEPKLLYRYQERYLHLLVDEFQDTNLVQYELIKQLGGKFRNICVVGDPDQSIYSWRFADLRNILNFEKDFPEAKVVLLEQNYRSTKMILETASCVISASEQRKPKGLWTENGAGELTTVVETYTEQEEAQFVASEIERLVERDGLSLRDCAVMYRTNAQSRALEETFIRYGVPYKLVAGTRFYERREVKDVIAYLRLIQNPEDSVSLLRVINVPGRGIGQRSLSQLADWARARGVSLYGALGLSAGPEGEEGQPPFNPRIRRALAGFLELISDFRARNRELDMAGLFDLVVAGSGYREYALGQADGEERWDNLLELRSVAQQYQDLKPPESLTAFLEGVALVSDVDGLDESAGGVTLITLHQAKGLEFPVVFIVGMEEGILPHFKSFDDPAQMEEERRLCYVGITRAKQRVYLVRAFRRSRMGSNNVSQPSRFLADIPRRLVRGGDLWHGEDSRSRMGSNNVSQPSRFLADIPRRGEDSQLTAGMYPRGEVPEATLGVSVPELRGGDHVRHPQFGDGVVVSCRPAGGDAEVVVAFDGAGIKKLLLSYARLEKVE